MDPISVYLASIGAGIASSTIYDILKKFQYRLNPSFDELKHEIVSVLNVAGADVYAEKIIQILAQNGNINIFRTNLFANESINMFSTPGHKLEFGIDSTSATKNTKITAKGNSKIIMRGRAGIRQNDDGSIGFYA